MNNLNSILLEGNLVRDPELRYTPSDGTAPGTALCTLVVSSVRMYKRDGERTEDVSFIEATTAGKLATVCAEHLTKGAPGAPRRPPEAGAVGGHRGQRALEGGDRRRARRVPAPPSG